MLLNANNKMIGDDYPYLIAAQWLSDLIARRGSSSFEIKPASRQPSKARKQSNKMSSRLMAREMLPLLLD